MKRPFESMTLGIFGGFRGLVSFFRCLRDVPVCPVFVIMWSPSGFGFGFYDVGWHRHFGMLGEDACYSLCGEDRAVLHSTGLCYFGGKTQPLRHFIDDPADFPDSRQLGSLPFTGLCDHYESRQYPVGSNPIAV